MAKRRDAIRMTEAEVEEFLAGRNTMNVATFNHDGTIHLVAMWYGIVDGAYAFETYAKSQKVVNLLRNPNITVLVETGDEYNELRGVEIVGTARIAEDEATVMATAASVVERYWGIDDPAAAEEAARMLANKRVAVVIEPQRIVSWDHGKLAGGY